jgi:beta-galactosidase
VPGAPAAAAFAWPAAGSNISLPFPWFNCYCGDIDLIGQPKPQWYYRRVLWGLSPVEMLVQRPVPDGRTEVVSWWGWSDELRSWTWPGSEGKSLKVRVYTSADEVRLLLNGREIAVKPVPQDAQLKVEFDVPYAAGELKAVARSNGRQVAECSLTTAGAPAGLRLQADQTTLRRSRNDLAYVTVEVVDRSGQLVPDAVVPVSFEVSGAGELAAAGSANPKDVFSFRRSSPKTFHGKALAIVRPHGEAGLVTVRAQAGRLTPGSLTLRVR